MLTDAEILHELDHATDYLIPVVAGLVAESFLMLAVWLMVN